MLRLNDGRRYGVLFNQPGVVHQLQRRIYTSRYARNVQIDIGIHAIYIYIRASTKHVCVGILFLVEVAAVATRGRRLIVVGRF